MAFDFPSSPTQGQQFTPVAGGPTYAWNGYAWDSVPAAVIPGTLVEIARQTVTSAVASVDFTSGIDTTYDEYEFHIFNVKPTAEAAILALVSFDAGANWRADNNYQYVYRIQPSAGSAADIQITAANNVWLGPSQGAGATSGPFSSIIRFWRPWDTVQSKFFMFDSVGYNGTVYGMVRSEGSFCYASLFNAINGVRFYPNTGNIAQGTFNLYGIKK